MVIDDKGGEIVHKDKWKDSERGEKQRYKWNKDISDKGEERNKDTSDKGKFVIGGEHTSRGSKLMNLYGAFECAFHMFACIA